MNDLVSVITPLYNMARFIADTIRSVQAQTYENWEMIIIDDGSTDSSVDIVRDFMEQDSRIKLHSLKNNFGMSYARNAGIEEAQGAYIAFLDADDIWMPEKLETQVKFMKDNNLPFTFSSYYLIDSCDNIIGEFASRDNVTYKDLLKTCSIGILTAIYDARVLGKRCFTGLSMREDYVLWLEIAKEVKSLRRAPGILAKYRIRGRAVSSNKLRAAGRQWCVYRKDLGLSFPVSLYYFTNYAFFGVKKHLRSFINLCVNKLKRIC